jgi:hypothetical protein
MRTKTLAAIMLGLLAAMPARAGDQPAHEPGTSVEMPYLIAPVIVDGQLYANAYVSTKIVAPNTAATIVVRDRLPFIQDAFVRDVNAAPIGKADDPKTVDTPALTARLLSDAKRIVGPAYVDSITIIRVQMSLLGVGAHS